MGFITDDINGPATLPEGFDLTPDAPRVSTFGAALRMQSPLFQDFSADIDESQPIDPDLRPWDEIQGTKYEPYGPRFGGARTRADIERMKLRIDREMADRQALDAAGGWGVLAEMGAALLSPSTLLPGGAVVKGAKGISILRSTASVGAAAAIAAAADEAVLHSAQITRTSEETALSVGGAFILGGLLGAGASKLAKSQRIALGRQIEDAIGQTVEADAALRDAESTVGARQVETVDDVSLELRGEQAMQIINAVPVLRALVRTDPILRSQLSPFHAARRILADLVETPLQYKAQWEGKVVRETASVETRIKERQNNDLARAMGGLTKFFAEYSKDGPVGSVGTITAPVTSRFQHLLGMSEKMGLDQFMEEVGRAMRSGDTHPIPQVAQAAKMLRETIFDRVLDDLVETGIFDSVPEIKNAKSYLTRSYNRGVIEPHWGDGSDLDMQKMLVDNLTRRRERGLEFLARDRTVDQIEADKFQTKERIREARKGQKSALRKAEGKKSRAEAAVARAEGSAKSTGFLRRILDQRADRLDDTIMQGDEAAAFKEALKEARSLKKLRPPDILDAIRAFGGIRGDADELRAALDQRAFQFQRNDGLDADAMREMLVEAGYLGDGATVSEMFDAIRRAAQGEDVFAEVADADLIARWEAAREFDAALREMDLDPSMSFDEIVKALPGKARNQATAKAKAGEARRSARKAGAKEGNAEAALSRALDRLDAAKDRLAELRNDIAPKVRAEISAAMKELAGIEKNLAKAKQERASAEFYAQMTDDDIVEAARSTIRSILGMKPGQSHGVEALADPLKARVLDLPDETLEPWLENDAGKIMHEYFRSVVPQLEVVRTFGSRDMAEVFDALDAEVTQQIEAATSQKAKQRLGKAGREAKRDLAAMRDRILGVYGVPENPESGWVRGGRVGRSLSYTGLLGGVMLSAIPDLGSVIGRNGIEAAFGSITALTDPKRFAIATKEAARELMGAAEWHLNSRAQSIADVLDPYAANTAFERGMAEATRTFSVASGMIPWNATWKSVGTAFVASRMSKAAVAVLNGKATRKQLAILAENDISRDMAMLIGRQVEKYADTDGVLWLPHAGQWDSPEAFQAFRHAMAREQDLMVITPHQDKPLAFSSEIGKFLSQFKTFGFSAYHRILLSGLQRHDGAVLAQVTSAIILGGLVSNLKADLGGYERKKGAAFWEDALDRSGITGWLTEAHGLANAFTGGALSISGERISRFQGRSAMQGLLGPTVDMVPGVYEGLSAMARGDHSMRDIRNVMRPIPGNNLWWLLGVTHRIEEALGEWTGARGR